MGCTLNHTAKDHRQAMKSIGAGKGSAKTLDKERREKIRAALNKSSSGTLLSILKDPHHPAYRSVSNLLVKSVKSTSRMTNSEQQKLPEAFRAILEKQSNAMGLFETAPSHRGPGSTSVQHHYEIFSAAALTKRVYNTASGKTLSIQPGDRIDFGIKFSKGYAQPKRYGTIEADILINKSSIMSSKTVAIDAKFSETGRYGVKDRGDLQRQLDGIRTGLRDGKVNEFCFVTNGEFGQGFKEMVKNENLRIARDWAKENNILYHDEKHGIPKEYLTGEERESIPPGKIPENFFSEFNEHTKEFVDKYKIQQIDLCEHLKYPGT